MVLQQQAACLVFSKQFCVHPTDVFLPFLGTESLNTRWKFDRMTLINAPKGSPLH